jgi:hypothetical protein
MRARGIENYLMPFDFRLHLNCMVNATSETLQNKNIDLLRSSFLALCAQFPTLSLSITLSESTSRLTVSDTTGQQHSLSLDELLQDTGHGIYDIILSIKEIMKLYDA